MRNRVLLCVAIFLAAAEPGVEGVRCHCDGNGAGFISATPCADGFCTAEVTEASLKKYMKNVPPAPNNQTIPISNFDAVCYQQIDEKSRNSVRFCTLQHKLAAQAFSQCPQLGEVVPGIKNCYCKSTDLCNGNGTLPAPTPATAGGPSSRRKVKCLCDGTYGPLQSSNPCKDGVCEAEINDESWKNYLKLLGSPGSIDKDDYDAMCVTFVDGPTNQTNHLCQIQHKVALDQFSTCPTIGTFGGDTKGCVCRTRDFCNGDGKAPPVRTRPSSSGSTGSEKSFKCHCDGDLAPYLTVSPCVQGSCTAVLNDETWEKFKTQLPPNSPLQRTEFFASCYNQVDQFQNQSYRLCTLLHKEISGSFSLCSGATSASGPGKSCYCKDEDFCNRNRSTSRPSQPTPSPKPAGPPLKCRCDGVNASQLSNTPCSNGTCTIQLNQAALNAFKKQLPPGATYQLSDLDVACFSQTESASKRSSRYCSLYPKLAASSLTTCPDMGTIINGIQGCSCKNRNLCNEETSRPASSG